MRNLGFLVDFIVFLIYFFCATCDQAKICNSVLRFTSSRFYWIFFFLLFSRFTSLFLLFILLFIYFFFQLIVWITKSITYLRIDLRRARGAQRKLLSQSVSGGFWISGCSYFCFFLDCCFHFIGFGRMLWWVIGMKSVECSQVNLFWMLLLLLFFFSIRIFLLIRWFWWVMARSENQLLGGIQTLSQESCSFFF